MSYLVMTTDYIGGLPCTSAEDCDNLEEARSAFERRIESERELSDEEDDCPQTSEVEFVDFLRLTEDTRDGNTCHCVGIIDRDDLISAIEDKVRESDRLSDYIVDGEGGIKVHTITCDNVNVVETEDGHEIKPTYVILRPCEGYDFSSGEVFDVHTALICEDGSEVDYVLPLDETPCEVLAELFNVLFC